MKPLFTQIENNNCFSTSNITHQQKNPPINQEYERTKTLHFRLNSCQALFKFTLGKLTMIGFSTEFGHRKEIRVPM